MTATDVLKYEATLEAESRDLCEALRVVIESTLPEAEGKVWHGHPVWFIDGNPIVGYHQLKAGVRVLFWSGQSFPTAGLRKSGNFQAAEFTPGSVAALADMPFEAWLSESRNIQWNYKNIMKNRGLVKLTSF